MNKYITGSYVALEKPDGEKKQVLLTLVCLLLVTLVSLSGGRYKKEVLVDGQSHLLLIREECGSPDAQVCVCVCACAMLRR